MVSNNFYFLQDEWKELVESATYAEKYIYSDTKSSFTKLRIFCERLVGHIYRELNFELKSTKQCDRLTNIEFIEYLDRPELLTIFHNIRIAGNDAIHPESCPRHDIKSPKLALEFIRNAHKIALWFYKTFSKEPINVLSEYIEIEHNDTLEKNPERIKQEIKESQQREQELQKNHNELGLQKDDDKIARYKEISRKVLESIDLGVDKNNLEDILTLEEFYKEFELTNEQNQLIGELQKFLKNQNQNVFLLKGYAGTGKTFILNGLTSYLKAVGRCSILMAPTGKASRVIKEKTQNEASTIHRAIYSMKTIKEYQQDESDPTYKYYYKLKPNENPDNTVYIIDESSMLSNQYTEMEFIRFGSGYLLDDLFKYINIDSNNHNKKVIFVGDNAQLPPVKMDYSPALNEKILKKQYGFHTLSFELSEVIRQKADSGILKNLMNLRTMLKEKTINKLDIEWRDDIKQINNEGFNEVYKKTNGDKPSKDTIVIAYTNKSVYAYNQIIRKQFFKNIDTLNKGDKIIILANSNFYDTYISNGDFGLVRKILSDKEHIAIPLQNKNPRTQKTEIKNIKLIFRNVEILVKDEASRPVIIECKILENLLFSGEANLSKDENKALYIFFKMRNKGLKPNSEEYKKALFNDPYFNALKIKFGYAITCHKAQGSEWKNVILDSKYIHKKLSESYVRWLYTAISRTSQMLYILNYEKISIFDGLKKNNSYQKVINHQNSTNTLVVEEVDNQFDIKNPFLYQIYQKIISLISNKNIDIVKINHKQYHEQYLFHKKEIEASVCFYYNDKNIITSIQYLKTNTLSDELRPIFETFKNHTIDIIDEKNILDFPEKFMKDFYNEIKKSFNNLNIEIKNIEHMQYRERYKFLRNNEIAIIDFIYNGKDQFTSNTPYKTNNSQDLIDDILGAINEYV